MARRTAGRAQILSHCGPELTKPDCDEEHDKCHRSSPHAAMPTAQSTSHSKNVLSCLITTALLVTSCEVAASQLPAASSSSSESCRVAAEGPSLTPIQFRALRRRAGEGEGEMDGIVHRTVAVNGINMHVAEKGEGPAVFFLHGFPELWYSWRHQILGLAARGYRAIAPDLRGYGDTDVPESTAAYSIFHIVGDLVALLDALGLDKVFVVGHDWGAMVAWYLCLFRPDRVKALVNMSVAYSPWKATVKPLDYFRSLYGDDYYIMRFQEPGDAEKVFEHFGTEFVMKKFLSYRTPGPLFLSKEFGGSPDDEIALPSWLTEEDINYFVSKFKKSGFTGGLNYYRNLNTNWERTAPWTGAPITVPTKFIVGDLDLTYHYPGIQDYIHKGGFKKDAPFLQDVVVMEGVGHFIIQEKASEITDHIFDFIQKF
ncbi:hypothetical protein Taro_048512 [Colocasia esculenta]|uniref:soluble epoxide hydrolase n=1 Tax=Colocasia esculenta TaxID=4460 RepID=A0A843X8C0_COLES|nr:hypothetical protein [Colocasia esculenta]